MTAPLLLTDEQMRRFIAHGYLCLKTELPPSFHRQVYARFEALIGRDEANNPGNNLLPLVPELDEVFQDRVVTGALTSVLGPGYAMHPHRALHNNMPGSDDQKLHKDSFWGFRSRVRNHHPRWAMIMYVPQATPVEQGPTAVVPGSQYQTRRPNGNLMPEVPGVLEEGGFLLIHYDVWHRKMKNFTDRNRFMMKFEFARMVEPTTPTWDHRDPDWHLDEAPALDMSAVWHRQWRWLGAVPELADNGPPDLDNLGRGLLDPDPLARLAATNALAANPGAARALAGDVARLLDDACDPVSLCAAYALAAAGEDAVGLLADAVRRNDGPHERERDSAEVPEDYIVNAERVARNATYGLSEAGAAAIPACLDLLANGYARARKLAVFALGEIAEPDERVDQALEAATRDSELTVRVNAAEALGHKPRSPAAVHALTELIRDPAADVRFSAVLALAKLGPGAEQAVPALQTALKDANRYVPGYAVEALQRIGTPQATETLIAFLKSARWCPFTSPKSIY